MSDDILIGGWCLSAYLYNTSGVTFARDLFRDAHPSYMCEKANTYGESQARALGALDDKNFRRLMEIAYRRYADQARAQFRCGVVKTDKPSDAIERFDPDGW